MLHRLDGGPAASGSGYAQKLDKSVMPNVTANLLPKLQNPDYDPGRNYSVPWQSGYAGIAYNVDGFKKLG